MHRSPKEEKLCRFGVSMGENLLGSFDELIAQKGYETRSKALGDLVRNALAEEALGDDQAEAVATISLVYNHHVRDLSSRLTEFQHNALDLIASTLHIHLDADSCLEVLVVRGPNGRVRALAEHLISIKGVKFGKFVTTLAPQGGHDHRHRD